MQTTGQIEVIRNVIVEHNSTDSFQDEKASRKLFFTLFGKEIVTNETIPSVIDSLKAILFSALQKSGVIHQVKPEYEESFMAHLVVSEGRQVDYVRPGGIGNSASGMLYLITYGLGQNLINGNQILENPQNHSSDVVVIIKTEFEQVKSS